MEYEKQLKYVLDKYKRKKRTDYLIQIPIYNEEKLIAFLRPITADFLCTMPECVALLGKWRVQNPTLSPARFTVTDERTQKWIENLVINNDNRIIFMIQDFSGSYLGHIGLAGFDYANKKAEIDSVLRGEKNVCPRLMEFAMRNLIEWGKAELKLERFCLEVLHDNEHAIDFYKRCGFVPKRIIPLQKFESEDEIKWTPMKDVNASVYEMAYLYMELTE